MWPVNYDGWLLTYVKRIIHMVCNVRVAGQLKDRRYANQMYYVEIFEVNLFFMSSSPIRASNPIAYMSENESPTQFDYYMIYLRLYVKNLLT